MAQIYQKRLTLQHSVKPQPFFRGKKPTKNSKQEIKETTEEASFSRDVHVHHELWPDVLLDIETFSRGLLKSLWLKKNTINVYFFGDTISIYCA